MIYFIPTTFVVSLIFIFISHSFAKTIGLVDKPTSRKHHKNETPLTGGLAVYSGALISLLVISPMSNNLYYLFVTASLIFLVGLIDDFKGLPPFLRISIQSAACLILVFGTNSYLYSLGDMFGLGEIILGYWGIPFTVFCVVGITNAFNMIDGLDGLAGCMCLVAIIGIFLFQIFQFQTIYVYFYYNLFLLFLLVALLPYLLCNLKIISNKQIFLGDSGSTFLGYIIAWSLVGLSQGQSKSIEPVDALWIVAIPLMDTIVTIFRRIYNKLSPFDPDRRHLHHILLKSGMSDSKALLAIVAVSLALIFFGVFNSVYLGTISSFLFIFMFLLYTFWNLFFFIDEDKAKLENKSSG